jgi:uncharacterized protein YbbC (DUF1343 family)
MYVKTGLDLLVENTRLAQDFRGNVALLCHNASATSSLVPAALAFKKLFGSRFIKLFGPQHGFSTDAQDNMIETDHFIHPYLQIPVYSLYSETRVPTDAMLEGIDHLFIDLQDIGCRMYTYSYTLTLILEKCAEKAIGIIILDRPNPINGTDIEGNVLEAEFASFIGRHPIPVRHAMTIGEVGLMHQQYWARSRANLRVIRMAGWKREMYFEDTGLPWLLPSPNIARPESALTFPGMVLFEGTHLSEGRGTTQSLEITGHPKIAAYKFFEEHLESRLTRSGLEGIAFRPITFIPTFHKHADKACGGFQMHITDRSRARPWRAGQFLLRELYHYLGDDFKWLEPPYEYDHFHKPVDIINGTDKLRLWTENNGALSDLDAFEDHREYREQLETIRLY